MISPISGKFCVFYHIEVAEFSENKRVWTKIFTERKSTDFILKGGSCTSHRIVIPKESVVVNYEILAKSRMVEYNYKMESSGNGLPIPETNFSKGSVCITKTLLREKLHVYHGDGNPQELSHLPDRLRALVQRNHSLGHHPPSYKHLLFLEMTIEVGDSIRVISALKSGKESKSMLFAVPVCLRVCSDCTVIGV